MTYVEKLKQFIAAVDYPVNIQVIECFWVRDDEGISWNTDNNLDNLQCGDGDTFSMEYEYANSDKEFEGYLVVNGNDGCGSSITYMFDLDCEVEFE